jgi:hypothetical protein
VPGTQIKIGGVAFWPDHFEFLWLRLWRKIEAGVLSAQGFGMYFLSESLCKFFSQVVRKNITFKIKLRKEVLTTFVLYYKYINLNLVFSRICLS